jgi:hypothetical protein
MNAHLFLDCRTKILDQMKSIGYLLGLRCAFTDGRRIEAAAISADDLDGGMVPQPPGCTIDTPIIENVDDRATLEINHDSAVSRGSPPTPVIDANHPNLGGAMSNRGIPLQLPQDGVVADRHAEPLHQALARTAPRAMAEQADNLRDPRRPARKWGSNLRQSVGECLSLTLLMCTSPAAQPKLHRYGLALDRQILTAAIGPAMPTSASPATIGANADPGPGSGNDPTIVISLRDTQHFDPWAGRPFRFRSHARP